MCLLWNNVYVFSLSYKLALDDKVKHWVCSTEKDYCFCKVSFYSAIIPSERCRFMLK